jgi:hypothetical protein
MSDRRPVATLVAACVVPAALGCSVYALASLRARDAEVAELRR